MKSYNLREFSLAFIYFPWLAPKINLDAGWAYLFSLITSFLWNILLECDDILYEVISLVSWFGDYAPQFETLSHMNSLFQYILLLNGSDDNSGTCFKTWSMRKIEQLGLFLLHWPAIRLWLWGWLRPRM